MCRRHQNKTRGRSEEDLNLRYEAAFHTKVLKLSQTKVAAMCGRTQSEISRWARGIERKNEPYMAKLIGTDEYRERSNANSRSYRATNRDTYNEWMREYNAHKSKHDPKRRAQLRAGTKLYKIRKKGMTDLLMPSEMAAIAQLYFTASKLTRETGIAYEVDHIRPLSKGGEHALYNLQILEASLNRSKKDKWGIEEQTYFCNTIFND
jgi:5-methylcytosine-specific restriction endonuclease McrA